MRYSETMQQQIPLAERRKAALREQLAGELANASAKDRQPVLKQLVGWEIAGRARSGQVIGLGSGTTSAAAIEALRERAREENLSVTGVCTSVALAQRAMQDGLISVPVLPDALLRGEDPPALDWGFDGADEIDQAGRMIKGGGGAHRIERMVADRTPYWIIIVDESKIVECLGAFPVPVEVSEEAANELIERFGRDYGARSVSIRMQDGIPCRTDSGNLILDVNMGAGRIEDRFNEEWAQLPGVIAHGLFLGYGQEILIACADGTISSKPGAGVASERP
ncbi:MAG: ribose 5-phosphate isomerase A [Patescibacteria group bacterium]|nr:ribose 5-phosphate isomerase A [Patescibacteria group bacterium]